MTVPQRVDLTPEVALAAACCAWPQSPPALERIRALAGAVRNWELFDAVVRRNRITPLADHALRTAAVAMPETVSDGLSKRAKAIGRRQLRMARESIRLQRAFDDAGIAALILKGIPLGILAFGQLGMKEAWDIDLLIEPGEAMKARDLLLGVGYVCDLDSDQFAGFLTAEIEVIFTHPESGITVELHRALSRNRLVLNAIDARGPAQIVSVAGEPVRTLADEPLFAHLCMHGALHNWGRLKWLADLNGFVAGCDETTVERLIDSARRYGVHRSASVALRLCIDLFGLQLSEQARAQLDDGPIARLLVGNVVSSLTYRGGGADHKIYTNAWLRTVLSSLVLEPGAKHLVEGLLALWNYAPDRAAFRFQRPIYYHLVRIPLALGRHGKRLLGRDKQARSH